MQNDGWNRLALLAGTGIDPAALARLMYAAPTGGLTGGARSRTPMGPAVSGWSRTSAGPWPGRPGHDPWLVVARMAQTTAIARAVASKKTFGTARVPNREHYVSGGAAWNRTYARCKTVWKGLGRMLTQELIDAYAIDPALPVRADAGWDAFTYTGWAGNAREALDGNKALLAEIDTRLRVAASNAALEAAGAAGLERALESNASPTIFGADAADNLAQMIDSL